MEELSKKKGTGTVYFNSQMSTDISSVKDVFVLYNLLQHQFAPICYRMDKYNTTTLSLCQTSGSCSVVGWTT